jgi:TRAP-type C4-dicarboxylate transport system permease small subunit
MQLNDLDAQARKEDGYFHVEDKAVDLSGTTIEAWVALGLFWLLGATVFYQFFTRYVLNDSAGWTEEIARYLLIGVVFVGSAYAVSRSQHIHVDFFYHLMPRRMARVMSTLVDLFSILFFAACSVLTVMMMQKLGNNSRMTMIDLPMNVVYGVCLFGFVAMTWRAIQVAWTNWKRGYSVLERPETALEDL